MMAVISQAVMQDPVIAADGCTCASTTPTRVAAVLHLMHASKQAAQRIMCLPVWLSATGAG